MEMATIDDIQKQIDELLKKKNEIIQKEKEAVIQDIKAKIKSYDITAQELDLPTVVIERTRAKSTKPVKAKYRGPNGEEWSGRGRKPQWIQNIETKGESIEKYLIKSEA